MKAEKTQQAQQSKPEPPPMDIAISIGTSPSGERVVSLIRRDDKGDLVWDSKAYGKLGALGRIEELVPLAKHFITYGRLPARMRK